MVTSTVAYAATSDFLDTFTAPKGIPLASRIWRQLNGYAATIQNNSVSFPSASHIHGSPAYMTTSSWSEDADISVKMNPSLITGNQGCGISNGNYYSTCGLEVFVSNYVNHGSTHSFDISWTDCKQFTTFYTGNKTYANSNLIHTLKITKRDNTYHLYIDNVAVTQSAQVLLMAYKEE